MNSQFSLYLAIGQSPCVAPIEKSKLQEISLAVLNKFKHENVCIFETLNSGASGIHGFPPMCHVLGARKPLTLKYGLKIRNFCIVYVLKHSLASKNYA
jgi:hypothetical protein